MEFGIISEIGSIFLLSLITTLAEIITSCVYMFQSNTAEDSTTFK
jgi:hypothetical protein